MVHENIDDIVAHVPALDTLTGRFLFIRDEILRDNITIAFQYIIFLISVSEGIKLQGPVVYSIFKDIMVYTGSVVESCLHYCINEYLKAGKINPKDVLPFEWKNEKIVHVCTTDDGKEVCSLVRYKKICEFTNKTQFQDINDIAMKAGILTKDLYEKSEKIRDDRNKVHLVALDKTHDYFTKDHVNETFRIAGKIIERVEMKLNNI